MPYFFSLVPIKEGGVNDLAADEAEAPADFAAPPSPCAPPLGCHPFLNVDILEVWLAVAGFGGGLYSTIANHHHERLNVIQISLFCYF